MAFRFSARTSVLLALLSLALPVALAQSTRDMATLMPAGTLVYFGWAELYDKDHPEMRFARELARCLKKHPESGDEGPVMQLLMDIAEIVNTVPTGIGLLDFGVEKDQPIGSAVGVVAAGERSQALATKIDEAIRGAGNRMTPADAIIAGASFKRVPLGDSPLALVWGVHKGHLIAAIGEAGAESVVKRLNGDSAPSLATNDAWKAGRARTQASDAPGWMFNAFLDVKGILAKGRKAAADAGNPLPPEAEKVIRAIGGDDLRSIYMHSTGTDLGPCTRCWLQMSEKRRGLLALWKQKPLDADDLKIVPKDAYWASVCNIDLAALWQETLDVIENVEPDAVQQVEGAIAATRGVLGFSITDDLLPALGDTWALLDAPAHGGFLITGTVLVADALKPEAIDGIFRRMVQIVSPFVKDNGVNLLAQKGTFDGYEVNYVVIGGAPAPVAPAWGMIEGRVVFGLFPQTVAAAMKQIDPKKRKESILDHAGVKAAMAKLPGKAVSWGYCDSQLFARLLHPLLLMYKTAIASYASAGDAVVDLSVLGGLEESLKSARAGVGVCTVDEQGVLYTQYGSANGTLAVIAGGSAATAILMPSLSRARELAKRAVSASNLRSIGMACLLWSNSNKEATPPSLEKLVETGTLIPQQLVSPREDDFGGMIERNERLMAGGTPDWKKIKFETSYVLIAGPAMSRRGPQTALVYERLIGWEGSNVLFADGHVEWMKLDQFKRAMRETYKAIGREGETPAEFKD
jgi:prepilin-type processing-associated H-X9-DG protein